MAVRVWRCGGCDNVRLDEIGNPIFACAWYEAGSIGDWEISYLNEHLEIIRKNIDFCKVTPSPYLRNRTIGRGRATFRISERSERLPPEAESFRSWDSLRSLLRAARRNNECFLIDMEWLLVMPDQNSYRHGGWNAFRFSLTSVWMALTDGPLRLCCWEKPHQNYECSCGKLHEQRDYWRFNLVYFHRSFTHITWLSVHRRAFSRLLSHIRQQWSMNSIQYALKFPSDSVVTLIPKPRNLALKYFPIRSSAAKLLGLKKPNEEDCCVATIRFQSVGWRSVFDFFTFFILWPISSGAFRSGIG